MYIYKYNGGLKLVNLSIVHLDNASVIHLHYVESTRWSVPPPSSTPDMLYDSLLLVFVGVTTQGWSL